MKVKITMTITLLGISFLSIGQNDATDNKSISAIANNTIQEQYPSNISKLINPFEATVEENKADIASENVLLGNEKKWKKIKKQIQRSKRKIANQKYSMYTSKIMDTVYLDIPASRGQSRLSDW